MQSSLPSKTSLPASGAGDPWGPGYFAEGKRSRPLASISRGGDQAAPHPVPFLSFTPGISLIMWNALYTAEKVIIRWTLLTEACYFSVQFLGES